MDSMLVVKWNEWVWGYGWIGGRAQASCDTKFRMLTSTACAEQSEKRQATFIAKWLCTTAEEIWFEVQQNIESFIHKLAHSMHMNIQWLVCAEGVRG